MPKRPATPRKQPSKTKRRKRRCPPLVQRPAQSTEQELFERYEEAICKRIMNEFGFAPTSYAALRDFRRMHSGEP